MKHETTSNGYALAAAFLAIVAILFFWNIALHMHHTEKSAERERALLSLGDKVTCGDLNSRKEVDFVFPNNPQLDGDKDGVACENIKK